MTEQATNTSQASAAAVSPQTSTGNGGIWLRNRRDIRVVLGASALTASLSLLPLLAVVGPWLGIILMAAMVCWGSNTVSHIHLHRAIFRARWANRAFSYWLTLVLGVPQTLWRDRHMWHHAGEPADKPPAIRRAVYFEAALVGVLWVGIIALRSDLFWLTYLPGYLLGLGLCQVQGRFEHYDGMVSQPAGISHYGRLHNLLWFNDGFHAEHHRWPGSHWGRLPHRQLDDASQSPWPPLLRWVGPWQARILGLLERWAPQIGPMQRWLVSCHGQAIARLLTGLSIPDNGRIVIVGGGLFPRTVLAMRDVLPNHQFCVVDACAANIERAKAYLANTPGGEKGVTFEHRAFVDVSQEVADLIVIPLAFVGDRDALYRAPGQASLLVHDWIWRRRGAAGTWISVWLAKRLNLVGPAQTKLPLHRTKPFFRLYPLLPHKVLNGFAGTLGRRARPQALIQKVIDRWIERAGIDMSQFEDIQYQTVEEFFLRRLRPGARPIESGYVSPVDGVVVASGTISADEVLTVKGERLSLDRLVNGRIHKLDLHSYHGGRYLSIFLTPDGYHRLHMPDSGVIDRVCWIPGRFFPQNDDALRHIARIYERNERATLELTSGAFRHLMVMVGASLIGGIHLTATSRDKWLGTTPYPLKQKLAKGDEVGHFSFGSTVVILLPGDVNLPCQVSVGQQIKMGQTLFDVQQ